MKVAVVQQNSRQDVSQNLHRAAELVAEAAAEGAQWIGLPENFAFMGDEKEKRRVAESVDEPGPILRAVATMAREANAYVLGGGMPERSHDEARPYNTAVLFAPTGELAARYRKIHLFDVDLPDGSHSYRESASTTAGADVVVTPILETRLGLSICYDLRFPELFRRMVDEDARVVAVPAAFTLATGKDHWHALLRARAIENGLFVLAPGQWGSHSGGRQTYGKSVIIDPWGDVIAQCSDGEGWASATLDFAHQERVRRSLPSVQHRRLK